MQRNLFFIILCFSISNIITSDNTPHSNELNTPPNTPRKIKIGDRWYFDPYGTEPIFQPSPLTLTPLHNNSTQKQLTVSIPKVLQELSQKNLTNEDKQRLINEYRISQQKLKKTIPEILIHLKCNKKKHKLKIYTIIPFIRKLLQHTSKSSLESIDEKTGQSILHALAPYNQDFAEELLKRPVNFLIQTGQNDIYPGSTILHIIAGFLKPKINMSKKTGNFFVNVAYENPEILTLTSTNKKGEQASTIIDLLHQQLIKNNHVSKDKIEDLIKELNTIKQQYEAKLNHV